LLRKFREVYANFGKNICQSIWHVALGVIQNGVCTLDLKLTYRKKKKKGEKKRNKKKKKKTRGKTESELRKIKKVK
jgi:hypothetical protein